MSEIELQDKILKHTLDLMRLSAHEQSEVVKILEQLEDELKQLLLSRDLSGASRAQINALAVQAGEVIKTGYATAARSLDTKALAIVIAEKTQLAIAAIIPTAVILPTPETLASLTDDVIIEGAQSSKWWSKQASDTAFKFAAQIRQGVINGETNEKIVSRITGKTGFMGVSRRSARTLVHSSVMASANNARLATYRKNSRLIKGVRQLSTLDSKTSDICIAYSDGEWDLDGEPLKGTSLPFNGGPPRHFACRSILTPIPKTFRDIGIDIDEPKDVGKRASSLGQIAGDTTFEGFLNRQPPEFADKVLGKGRADLWRAGKITLRDLVSGTGRPLTLEQLRKKG